MTDGGKTSAEEQANEHVKDFFLDLASKGKQAWNEWRRANEDVHVTFAGIDFSEAPRDEIDFSGFEFGEEADFSRCKWRGIVREVGARRGPDVFRPGRACFTGASFGDEASFEGATFGGWSNFTGAAFGGGAEFTGGTFGNWATFTGAVFGSLANFTGVVFGSLAIFSGADLGAAIFNFAAFGGGANFNRAAFGHYAGFIGTTFGGGAEFFGATFGGWANFTGAAFGATAYFRKAIFRGLVEFTGKSQDQWIMELDGWLSSKGEEALAQDNNVVHTLAAD